MNFSDYTDIKRFGAVYASTLRSSVCSSNVSCTPCSSGVTGATGSGSGGGVGETGITGGAGATGITGSGIVGSTGATGSGGGSTGETGADGSAGVTGETGSQGQVGNTGSTGSDGLAGATGSDGATGSTGQDGITGATGGTLAGATGATGQQGSTGEMGSVGTQGQTGSTGFLGVIPQGYGSVVVNGPTGSSNYYTSDILQVVAGASGDYVSIGGSLIPDVSLSYSLGSTGQRWSDIFIGPGTLNIAGPVGSAAVGTIGTDSQGIVYTEFGFASPFLNIGAQQTLPLATGGWVIGATGDPLDYANYDLIATQNTTDGSGITGPSYSLIRRVGPTGATGSDGSGVTGATGSDGSDGVTGATGTSITGSTGPLNTEVMALTSEPTGHAVRTDSQISFDPATRVFTIQPTTSSFDVWVAGCNYTKTTAETTTIPASSGLYYIPYNSDGTLSNQTTFFVWDQQAPTAYVYYNTGATGEYMLFDERHGVTMDWATHEYLHRTRGAQIANGFALENYTTTGTGDVDTDAQVSVENGTFFDEDLQVDITNGTPGTGEWVQQLQSPARLPVIYLNGGAWRKTDVSDYPLYIDSGDTRPAYNSITGGVGSLVETNNNTYIVQFLAATNMVTTPVISIMGQATYSSLAQAEESTWNELYLTNLPIVEIRPLWRLIFEVRDSYTNAVNSRLVDVSDLRGLSVITGVGPGAQGDQGATGATGQSGVTGITGTEGATGATGVATSRTLDSSFLSSNAISITGTTNITIGPYSITSNALVTFSGFIYHSSGGGGDTYTFNLASNNVPIAETINKVSLTAGSYGNISCIYLDKGVSGTRSYSIQTIGTTANGTLCNTNLIIDYL